MVNTNPYDLSESELNRRLQQAGITTPVMSSPQGGYTIAGSETRYSQMGVADFFGVPLESLGPDSGVASGGSGSASPDSTPVKLLLGVAIAAYAAWAVVT